MFPYQLARIVRLERQAQLVKRLWPGSRTALIAYQSLLVCTETLDLMKWHLEIERQALEWRGRLTAGSGYVLPASAKDARIPG